ncbi:hypothetical protein PS627_04259 [Pseudomonas fluorescens]|nr:hypothetical protein PS627_04259 [Pseudomonas fluorescens]VVP69100.1 hypothetical protein PS910_00511 [Pseudomonas fluorescens]
MKTGHPDQPAYFCPVLYKLTLFKSDAPQTLELGFSGGRVLERLMQEPGQVIDRQTLIAHAWQDRVVGPGSLNQQIHTLRKILGDEKERQIIQTVARRGYRFNPAFVLPPPAAHVPEQAAQPPAEAVALPPRPAVKRRRWTLGIVVATVLVGNFFTTLPTQLHASRQQVGENSVVYVESKHPQLHGLIQHTHQLSRRILALSDTPVDLAIVGGGNGYYHIYCAPQGRESHRITVHHDQIRQVSDSQLRHCIE